jgi:thioredoxin-dependent peroxiredoxin
MPDTISSPKEVLMLNVGEAAPDFTVQTHTGEWLKLSSLRGHRVLLWFYPVADTPG